MVVVSWLTPKPARHNAGPLLCGGAARELTRSPVPGGVSARTPSNRCAGWMRSACGVHAGIRLPGGPGAAGRRTRPAGVLSAGGLDGAAGLRSLSVLPSPRRPVSGGPSDSVGGGLSGSADWPEGPSTRTISTATCGTPTASRPPARRNGAAPEAVLHRSGRARAVPGRSRRHQLSGAAHHLWSHDATRVPPRLLGCSRPASPRCKRSSSFWSTWPPWRCCCA